MSPPFNGPDSENSLTSANRPGPVENRSAVVRSQQKLDALRLAVEREKRKLREASARERGVREGTLGRAVLALVERGCLDNNVIALIRDEVHAGLSACAAGAFVGTQFE